MNTNLISIPSGAIKRIFSVTKSTLKILFQFLLVRLRVTFGVVTDTEAVKFQFLLVRLRVGRLN